MCVCVCVCVCVSKACRENILTNMRVTEERGEKRGEREKNNRIALRHFLHVRLTKDGELALSLSLLCRRGKQAHTPSARELLIKSQAH